MLTKKERTTIFPTQVLWKSGSTLIDPSSNMSYIDIYNPEGDKVISESSQRYTTGTYRYYISTQSTDNLGIWVVDHWSYFNYQGRHGWQKKHNYEPFQLVYVKQD